VLLGGEVGTNLKSSPILDMNEVNNEALSFREPNNQATPSSSFFLIRPTRNFAMSDRGVGACWERLERREKARLYEV
jgi:hypothetical protein